MRPDQILESVKNDLDAWAAALTGAKARISVAKDPWNALELLVQGPAGLIVVIHWAGDEGNGRTGDPKADNTLEVIVGYNLGLTLPLDQALFKSTVDRPSLLKYVNDVRARLLTIQFPADETIQTTFYAGCEPVVAPQGIPLAAYRIRARLDAIVETEEDMRPAVYTA
jgi:hypothetical protein